MFVYTLQLLLPPPPPQLPPPPPQLPFRYMMREKLDESAEWKAVTSEQQRQACTEAVAAAGNWFDEEVGVDTNTSQVRIRCSGMPCSTRHALDVCVLCWCVWMQG